MSEYDLEEMRERISKDVRNWAVQNRTIESTICAAAVHIAEAIRQSKGEASTPADVPVLLRDLIEARDVLFEAIEDEDFQPIFSSHDYAAGPALLGHLTRAHDAICRALRGAEEQPQPGGCDKCGGTPFNHSDECGNVEPQPGEGVERPGETEIAGVTFRLDEVDWLDVGLSGGDGLGFSFSPDSIAKIHAYTGQILAYAKGREGGSG